MRTFSWFPRTSTTGQWRPQVRASSQAMYRALGQLPCGTGRLLIEFIHNKKKTCPSSHICKDYWITINITKQQNKLKITLLGDSFCSNYRKWTSSIFIVFFKTHSILRFCIKISEVLLKHIDCSCFVFQILHSKEHSGFV